MALNTKAGSKGATKTKPAGKVVKKTAGSVKVVKKAGGKPALNKLGYAIVFVSDMKRGVTFYKDVLGVPMRFDSPEWTEFDMNGVTLALHAADKMPKNLDQAPITELCFETGDVRTTRDQLIGSGVKVSDLKMVCEMGPNVGAAASFRDPDGNHLSIFGLIPKAQWSGPTDR
jgi:lactoylglutathione lyase